MQSLPIVKLNLIDRKTDEQSTLYINPRTLRMYGDIDKMSMDDAKLVSPMNVNRPMIYKNKYARIIQLYLGSYCNMRCSYCRQWEHEKELVPYTDKEIDFIVEHIYKYVNFDDFEKLQFWGGEPLLYIDTIRKIVSKLPKEMRIHITSNGLLFDKSMYDMLIDRNFSFTLSYDGTGQKKRGKTPFDNPEAAKYLRLLNKNRNGRKVKVNTVLTELNLDLFELVNHHIDIMEDPTVRIKTELAIPYNEWANKEAANTVSQKHIEETLFTSMVKLDEVDHLTQITNIEKALDIFVGVQANPYYCLDMYNIKCNTGIVQSLCFDRKGDVYPCQVFGGTKNIIGRVEDHPVLSRPSFDNYLLNNFNRTNSKRDCRTCLVPNFCRGVCPYMEQKYMDNNCENKFVFFYSIFRFIFHQLGYHIESTEVVYKEG